MIERQRRRSKRKYFYWNNSNTSSNKQQHWSLTFLKDHVTDSLSLRCWSVKNRYFYSHLLLGNNTSWDILIEFSNGYLSREEKKYIWIKNIILLLFYNMFSHMSLTPCRTSRITYKWTEIDAFWLNQRARCFDLIWSLKSFRMQDIMRISFSINPLRTGKTVILLRHNDYHTRWHLWLLHISLHCDIPEMQSGLWFHKSRKCLLVK